MGTRYAIWSGALNFPDERKLKEFIEATKEKGDQWWFKYLASTLPVFTEDKDSKGGDNTTA